MKVYISSDIEGVNGTCAWCETEKGLDGYAYYADRMTKGVAAVCKGINKSVSGAEIFVKDAHDSARNIDHAGLPENAVLNRGWGQSPYCMLLGIDEQKFDACIFTGYHSAGSLGSNPLSHTMSTETYYIKINGEIASEFLINYYAAMYVKTPVILVTGDEALCEAVKKVDSNIYTVVEKKGIGGSVTSRHPRTVEAELEEKAAQAIANCNKMKISLPSEFKCQICYKKHSQALKASYYPGAYKISDTITGFDTKDFYEFLRFMVFVI